MSAPIEIALIFQSLLGIYGDQGNAEVLMRRLAWRNIDAKLTLVEPGDELPRSASIYLLGGGEDRAQTTAVRALSGSVLPKAVDQGAVVFAVCAGYQLLGTSFTIGHDDTVIEGLGLLDVETRRGSKRAVGEIVTTWSRPDGTTSTITGFENHGGFTRLGSGAIPLAQVIVGVGNGYDATEGAVALNGRVIGTYPHGPVLARNPDLADHLLSLALGEELDPLPCRDIDALRDERLKRAQQNKKV